MVVELNASYTGNNEINIEMKSWRNTCDLL